MDDIRGSFSKMKKKLKHRLAGGKHKPEGTGTNPDVETADSTSSLPQPELHIVADESHDQEGDRADTAGERVFSTDQPLQPAEPESVPAREDDNGQGGEVADVEVTVESGRSGEPEGVHPSPSTPSISHGGKLDST